MKLSIKLSYLVYSSIFFMMIGVYLSPFFNKKIEVTDESHEGHYTHDHSMSHGELNVSSLNAPSVEIRMEQDKKSGWNLTLYTENFIFTPENTNKENEANTGHAHLYINGEKITRLYGNHYYLSDFPPGDYEIKVNLNSNDHSTYMIDGNIIQDKTTIVVQ